MAFNYSTLVSSSTTPGSIASWLNHSALQNAAPFIVSEAESFIYSRLRTWQMLTSVTGNITSATGTIALPSDWIEDKKLIITGVNKANLVRKPMQEVIDAWAYDGSGNRIQSIPNIFFNDNTNIVFDTLADQTYPYLHYYYQNPAPLSTSGTNFVTVGFSRMFRAAIMIGACEFMKDAGVGNFDRTYWIEEAEKECVNCQVQSDHAEHTLEAGFVQI